jgi:hypothetical protein
MPTVRLEDPQLLNIYEVDGEKQPCLTGFDFGQLEAGLPVLLRK